MVKRLSPEFRSAPDESEVARRTRELETLHRLGRELVGSLESRVLLERSLNTLIEQGWFTCGEAFLRVSGDDGEATLDTVAVALCPFDRLSDCPLRPRLERRAAGALAVGGLQRFGSWQLLAIEDLALLALAGGASASVTFLEAVADLVAASLRRTLLHRRLAEKEQQRSRLLQALLSTQEEERGRISRDLHDQIGQALTALLLGLDRNLAGPDVAELQRLKELTSVTLADVRRIALDLRPSVLDELGLEAALRRYARDVNERYRLELSVLVNLPRRLSRQEETVLYRVVQEAVTNVVRHAEARFVSVVVTTGGDSGGSAPGDRSEHVKLVVEDDGVGFAPAALSPAEQIGLVGMRERMELLGGSLRVESAPGEGCSVYARLPLR